MIAVQDADLARTLLPAGLAALAVGAPLARWTLRRRLRRPAAPKEGAPGGAHEVLFAPLLFVAGTLLASLLLQAMYPDPEDGPPVAVALASVAVSLLPLVLLALAGLRRGSRRALGLGPGATTGVGAALLDWLLCLPVIYGLLWVSPWLYETLAGGWEPQSWGQELEAIGPAEALPAALLAVFLVPVIEELIFRGWLQQIVARRAGPVAGVLLSSVLFALVHDPGVWLPIFALALLLGLLREHTQRLMPAIAVHIAHNGLQVSLMLSGLL